MPKGSGKYSNSGKDKYSSGMELVYPKKNTPMMRMDPQDREAWGRIWHVLPKGGVDRREVKRIEIENKSRKKYP